MGRKCITAGYFHQAARVKGIGEYMNIRTAVSQSMSDFVGVRLTALAAVCVTSDECAVRSRM